jgi:hypothetical protein
VTILTSNPKTNNRSMLLIPVNLTSRIPLYDPGGWFTVLYGQLPAADLRLADPCGKRLSSRIVKSARENSSKFLLIDLDQHPWLANEPGGLRDLMEDAAVNGLRLVPFGDDRLPAIEACESREAAIEACLAEWEEQLLERFWW